MKAKLISQVHGEFEFGPEATIGREENCTVSLGVTVVSSQHARITFDPARSAYVLEDLGSLNGTQLDGVEIDREEVLGRLNLISFGGSEDFIFQQLNVEGGGEIDTIEIASGGKTQIGDEVPVLPAGLQEESTAKGEAKGEVDGEDQGGTRVEKVAVPIPDVLAQEGGDETVDASTAGTGLALEFALGDKSKRFFLEEGENLVGRARKANIWLDVADLSRRHATVTVAEGKVLVRDEGSRNHTFVDGERLEEELVIAVGSKLVFGRVQAVLLDLKSNDSAPPEKEIETETEAVTETEEESEAS